MAFDWAVGISQGACGFWDYDDDLTLGQLRLLRAYALSMGIPIEAFKTKRGWHFITPVINPTGWDIVMPRVFPSDFEFAEDRILRLSGKFGDTPPMWSFGYHPKLRKGVTTPVSRALVSLLKRKVRRAEIYSKFSFEPNGGERFVIYKAIRH